MGCEIITVNTDSGSAATSGCEMNILGGTGISVSGAGDTVIIDAVGDNITLDNIYMYIKESANKVLASRRV